MELITRYKNKLIEMRYAKSTISTYSECFRKYLFYFKGSDYRYIRKDQIEGWLLNLVVNDKISKSYQNQMINAVKFYYEKMLGTDRKTYFINRPRKDHHLPDFFTKEEVQKILFNLPNLKHKSIIQTIYDCGLRISEVINLKPEHINRSDRKVLVKNSKGNKDRYTIISDHTLSLLTQYYIEYKPVKYMFNGQSELKYSAESIRKSLKKSAEKSGINRSVYPHMLRHSFATHMLENGIDIRVIQHLMGHGSIKTTEIYTHVSNQYIGQIKSPIG